MCGIVGYIGDKDANEVLINGLRKLEYRGYDSCGLATITNNELNICKTLNRIDTLASEVKETPKSHIGIGHTRWATHGGVYEKNAHPHTSRDKKFIVVHNGIIENYLSLKEMLQEKGYIFYSDTDTEVIPNLIEYYYDGNLLETVKKVTSKLEGSFALGIMSKENPNELIATKRNSPLIVGIGNGENFIASDFSAVLKYTDKICILENDDIAILNNEKVEIYDNNLDSKEAVIKEIDMNDNDIEKNGFDHFMLKEINENTITVKKTLDEYIKDGNIKFNLNFNSEDWKNIKQINIVACGTAMHAGLNGKHIIEKLTRIPVNVEVASEFRYSNPILSDNNLVIFISQSGETADTIACLELVKKKKVKHLSIVNVKESTMDRISENVLYTKAGPEIAVASTKAYIAQVMLIDLFAIYLAEKLGTYDAEKLKQLIASAIELPTKIQEVLEQDKLYYNYAKTLTASDELDDTLSNYSSVVAAHSVRHKENIHSPYHDVFFLGRGLDYYIALEGSLKLKEISYIHSEGTQFGELKHGPIALMENGTPAIVIATQENLLEKTISNIKEIKARGARVLAVTTLKNFPVDIVDETINLPEVCELFAPLEAIIPLQLIAYHVTVLKGLDVDKPRNLAKSVTVE